LDRILFGTNTILVFKFPFLKRKLEQVKQEILSKLPSEDDLPEDKLETLARQLLIDKGGLLSELE
jgi:hypothetical protein